MLCDKNKDCQKTFHHYLNRTNSYSSHLPGLVIKASLLLDGIVRSVGIWETFRQVLRLSTLIPAFNWFYNSTVEFVILWFLHRLFHVPMSSKFSTKLHPFSGVLHALIRFERPGQWEIQPLSCSLHHNPEHIWTQVYVHWLAILHAKVQLIFLT